MSIPYDVTNFATGMESTVNTLEGKATAAIEQVNKLLSSQDYTPQYIERQIGTLKADTGAALAAEIENMERVQQIQQKAAKAALQAIPTPDDASLRRLEYTRDTLRAQLQLEVDEESANQGDYSAILEGFQQALEGDDALLVRAYLLELGGVLRTAPGRAGQSAYNKFQGMVKTAQSKLMTSEQKRALAVLNHWDTKGHSHLLRLQTALERVRDGEIQNGKFVDGFERRIRRQFNIG